jgi:hypothetical protein
MSGIVLCFIFCCWLLEINPLSESLFWIFQRATIVVCITASAFGYYTYTKPIEVLLSCQEWMRDMKINLSNYSSRYEFEKNEAQAVERFATYLATRMTATTNSRPCFCSRDFILEPGHAYAAGLVIHIGMVMFKSNPYDCVTWIWIYKFAFIRPSS